MARNLRFALRLLLRSPGFTLVAALTLALGIGLNTSIFSLLYEALLRPLPYPDSDSLVQIETVFAAGRNSSEDGERALFWKAHVESVRNITIVGGTAEQNLAGGAEPERVRVRGVTAGFFGMLGAAPALGRDFRPGEDTSGAPLAILGYRLWRRHFGGDTSVLGRGLTIGSKAYTIAGVAPPNLDPTLDADVFTPLDVRNDPEYAGMNFLVLGRIPSGESMARAQAGLQVAARQYLAAHPPRAGSASQSLAAFRYAGEIGAESRTPLLILAAAAGMVLLIACANVANLLLARVTGRRREIAVRLAIGASRLQIASQLLAESLCLALAGGVLGLLLARFTLSALLALNPPGIPNLDRVSLNAPALLFALAASVLTSLLFGLAPALQALSADVNQALSEGGARGASARSGRVLREVLAAAQFSLSLLLIIGAALLSETFVRLRLVDPGFDIAHLLTLKVSVSGPGYDTSAAVARFASSAVDGLRRLPGVRSAAATNYLPLATGFNIPLESIAGRPNPEKKFLGNLQWFGVSSGFFSTFGIRLTAGRAFDPRDNAAGSPVVIVNQAFVRRYFPGRDPLGAQIVIAWSITGPAAADPPRQIIGVAADLHEQSLASPPEPGVFVPLPQVNDAISALVSQYMPLVFVVNTNAEPAALARQAAAELRRTAGALPVYDVRPMTQVVGASIANQRFLMALTASFALLALCLAAIGIYGVMSYAVAQRTREFGIRAALGAAPSQILGMVITRGLALAAAGMALGVAGAIALTRILASLLYGVSARDPLTFLLAPLSLLLVALAACWLPARRAVQSDPLAALRWE